MALNLKLGHGPGSGQRRALTGRLRLAGSNSVMTNLKLPGGPARDSARPGIGLPASTGSPLNTMIAGSQAGPCNRLSLRTQADHAARITQLSQLEHESGLQRSRL